MGFQRSSVSLKLLQTVMSGVLTTLPHLGLSLFGGPIISNGEDFLR